MDSARLFWYIDVTFDKSELRGFTKFHPSILKITTLEVPLNAFLLCHVKLKVSGNRCFSPTVEKCGQHGLVAAGVSVLFPSSVTQAVSTH